MIPRVIHRIWIAGSPPAPPVMIRNGRLWRDLNPGWEVRTWSGPEELRLRNECLYKRAPRADGFRFRADLLRLEILEQVGGLYVDMDVEPLRPVEELLEGEGAVAAWSPNRWKGERVLSNAFMAAEPGHPWIARCVFKMRLSVRTYAGQFLAMVTGPHHVNRCLRPEDGVKVYESRVIYPRTHRELQDAFTFHTWENRQALRRERLPA